MSELLKKKKRNPVSGPSFPFFNNKMEHPHVKRSLIFLIVLLTSKLSNKITQLSVLIWRKTRKRKPWTISFIEEAWICRTGAVFQRFLVKRRLARSERESASREREGVKKKPRKITCTPMHTKIEKPRKTFWEKWIAREVMIRIKLLKKMIESLEKKRNPVS